MVSLGSEYINSLYLYNLRIVMTETEMVQRIRKGDRKAFDFLCREYYAAFISYAKRYFRMTVLRMWFRMFC